MSVLTVISRKLMGIFLGILGLFKRAMCFLGRRRKNSGTLLPTANHYPSPMSTNITQSVPGNDEVELESWDNWGQGEGPVNISVVDNGMAGGHVTNNYPMSGGYPKKNMDELPDEPEPDYFSDMTPQFRRPKTLLIKKAEQQSGGISSRLTMASEIPPHMNPELGSWEDSNNAWEEDLSEDLSWEADKAIKEKRYQERERRVMEHQKKKLERESQKLLKKDSSSHIAAVRLS